MKSISMVERPESAYEADETSYYYEEEIIDDESSTIIEEEVIDEHDFVEIVQAHRQYHHDDVNEHDQGDYISVTSEELIEEEDDDDDDDSSAPPPSYYDGNPSGGTNGSGWQDSLGSCLDITVDVAVQEGARKASQEAQAREEYLQRLGAREALQRKCREQQEHYMVTTATTTATAATTKSDIHNKHIPNSRRGPYQGSSKSTDESSFAMQILKERLHIVELAVAAQSPNTSIPTTSTTKSHAPHSLGTVALEKRKQALAELRRLAARDQLARNVDELKSGKSMATTTAA